LIDDAVFLLEARLMFLIDDDQSEIGIGEEERRARADDDLRLAVEDRAPGEAPLEPGQFRMPLRRQRAEAPLEAPEPLRAERDLGDQHQRLAAGAQARGDRLEIDL